METIHLAYLLSLAVLIYISGRFSGAETSITALTKVDLAQMKLDNDKHVDLIIKLRSDMDSTIITILIGNNLVNITASAISTKLAYDLLGDLGISIAIGVLTILVLIFAEITPKGFAIKNKKRFAIKNAKFIFYLSKIFYPLIIVLSDISNSIIRFLGGETKKEKLHITEGDVRDLASMLKEEGQIKEIEQKIVHNVFWFGDVKVRSVKIPRDDSFVLDSMITVDEGVEFIKEHGLTRIPVSKHGSDQIIGIVYSKDLLGEERGTMEDYARDVPMAVGNDDEITDVFQRMRKSRIHMAIIVDDEGNFDGLITLEDIVEELLGEIYDEFDRK